MPLTNEELQAVKDTGICHEVELKWQRFMDGTGVDVPVPKARSICSICQTEFIKSVQVVNLDQV